MSVVVVGCGHWGKNLIRNFSEIGELSAVCDNDKLLASKFSEKYKVPSLSYDEVLRSSCRAVVIAVPAKHHAKLCMDAFEANKHVYVEKPLAMNRIEADKMIKKSKEKGLHLMVGHLLQYHPVFRKLKEMNINKEFGEIEYIYSNRLSFGKIRSEENVIWSFAPHDISMILSLINSNIKNIHTKKTVLYQKGIPDMATIYLEFDSGVKGHISCSWANPIKEQKLVLIGSKATAIFDDTLQWDRKLMVLPQKINFKKTPPETLKKEPEFIKIDEKEPLKEECKYFIDLLNGKVSGLTDGEEGKKVLEVLEASDN